MKYCILIGSNRMKFKFYFTIILWEISMEMVNANGSKPFGHHHHHRRRLVVVIMEF